jgi:O-antigen/teichoic acid export membrane protein
VLTSGATALSNIVLCLALIPPFGALGAAGAMVLPSALQFWLLACAARQAHEMVGALRYGLRAAALIAVITGAVWVTRIPWFVAVVVASLASAVVVWCWSGLDAAEKELIGRVWRRFASRFRFTRSANA